MEAELDRDLLVAEYRTLVSIIKAKGHIFSTDLVTYNDLQKMDLISLFRLVVHLRDIACAPLGAEGELQLPLFPF